MEITCWTQSHDYSSQDHGAVTLDQAEKLIHDFDWTGQSSTFEEMLRMGDDACPPGVGLEADDGLYHVYTFDSLSWELRVELPSNRKFLGFIPRGPKRASCPFVRGDRGDERLTETAKSCCLSRVPCRLWGAGV